MLTSNIEKGELGEKHVYSAIIEAAKISNTDVRVYNNVILEFPSMYGRLGMLTTEIDHVVITPCFIVLIETKNDYYKINNYEDYNWQLLNDTETSNPIMQNQLHKSIFCSVFDVLREKVLTVECLLKCNNCRTKTQFPNDFVLGSDNIRDGFVLLLATKGSELERDSLCNKLKDIELSSNSKREAHIENIKNAEKIERWTRTHEGHYNFKRTDIAICPACGGRLFFRGYLGVDYSRGNTRKSQQYLIGCSNYRITGCSYHKNYKKEKGVGFDEVHSITLQERMGWNQMEVEQKTILDKYYEQKIELEEREKVIIKLNNRVNELTRTIDEKNKYISSLSDQVKKNEEKVICFQEQFKQICGPLYIKK